MTIQTDTLRPGRLVSLKTSTRGNVTYVKSEIEQETTEAGTSKKKWETTRTIVDAVEHEAAEKTRSQAWRAVASVCVKTAFGLLCPEANIEGLDKAVVEARKLVDAFNATASLSRVSIFVITGKVSPDDVEALKAINSEVRDLMEDMQRGMRELDVKAVREAATKAKEVGGMLSADYEAKVQIAVEAARSVAKKIVADGKDQSTVDQFAINKITEMRTAFLDLDDSKEVQAPAHKGRSLDLAGA